MCLDLALLMLLLTHVRFRPGCGSLRSENFLTRINKLVVVLVHAFSKF